RFRQFHRHFSLLLKRTALSGPRRCCSSYTTMRIEPLRGGGILYWLVRILPNYHEGSFTLGIHVHDVNPCNHAFRVGSLRRYLTFESGIAGLKPVGSSDRRPVSANSREVNRHHEAAIQQLPDRRARVVDYRTQWAPSISQESGQLGFNMRPLSSSSVVVPGAFESLVDQAPSTMVPRQTTRPIHSQ